MSFMERARALYHRDDRVRAAFVLAEGIKREPRNEEALNWFLQLYVEELQGPGLEQELLRVLDTQPDGEVLLDGIQAEMARRQQTDRISALKRVFSLRRRAEAARPVSRVEASLDDGYDTPDTPPSSHDPLVDPSLLDDDDAIRALEETARRRRRRRRGRPVTEPLVPLEVPVPEEAVGSTRPSEPSPEPAVAAGTSPRRRRRRRPEGSPQGVLPLELPQRPPTDSWRGFRGVARDVDPKRIPVGWSPTTGSHSAVPATAKTADGEPPRRQRSSPRTQPSADQTEPAPLATTVDGGRAAPPVEDGDLEPILDLGVADDDPRGEHALTTSSSEAHAGVLGGDTLGLADARSAAFDQLLRLDGDDEAWSFGDEGPAPPAMAPDTAPAQPSGRRLRRGRGRSLAQAGQTLADVGDGVRALGRGVRWAARGRRGPVVLALVALLSLAGIGYRACTQFVDSQLAEADEALRMAQGDSLHRAVQLYAEHVGEGPGGDGEKLDFARALLRADHGESAPAPGYEAEAAQTPWGLAALALHRVADDNLPVARALGEEIVDRFPDDWLAHWARGRVAVADADWARAAESFERAATLDPAAAYPAIGLVDLALRGGRDDQVEASLEQLAQTNPDHPLIPIARATVAFGVSPLESRVASLPTALPNPRQTRLSLRERELISVLRARQALAAWQLDQVAQTMRGLREQHPATLGVRANLLDAVLAARRYRLGDAVAALEQGLNAAPPGSPATSVVRELAAELFIDLGRPDLALGIAGDGSAAPVTRSRLLIEAGRESEALRWLGQLLDRADTGQSTRRTLVDFHLRRGVHDRAALRAEGLDDEADQAYARARLAADAGDWSAARDHADQALRLSPRDVESLSIWARAMAELGFAERGIERIDEHSARSILVGEYDRARLDVLVASRRAPRETLSEFASLLESTQPSSMTRLVSLARAYEAIGDSDRARQAAEQVLQGEPNNREMHALLGRIHHAGGQVELAQQHLRAYLELAPEAEPTDWAREILRALDT